MSGRSYLERMHEKSGRAMLDHLGRRHVQFSSTEGRSYGEVVRLDDAGRSPPVPNLSVIA